MSERNTFIRSNRESLHNNKGNGKVSHCLSVISSVFTGGHNANIMSTNNSEDKNMKIMMPYGIASFPYKGMQAQVIYNDGNNTIVGVFDENRPPTELGDVIIYNKSGSYIKLDADGNISINGPVEVTGTFKINGQTVEDIVSSMI